MYEKVPDRIRLLKEKGRYDEAADEIRQGLEKNPHDLSLKTSLADLYLRQGSLAEGRILTEEVLAQDPRHPQALSLLGDLFLKDRSPQKALECYRQAFNRDPRPYLVLKSARALKEMGNLPEAQEELEKVLVVNPENVSFLKEKAFILNRRKKFDQALKIFEKIKKINPHDPFVQKEILRLRSRNRPPDQVLKELQAVIGMDSQKDDAQVHGLFAQQLKKAGQVREAAAEYRKASELEPSNSYFLKQEGFCLYQLKEYQQAAVLLSEVFRKDPGDYYVRGTLGKSFEAIGNLTGWIALLEEVAPLHPGLKSLLGIIRKVRKKTGAPQEEEP
ncbi:MAG: tetratricopeptide repeat protein [Deltaproteobacteria bacterium]|nr:tetratricopeptide repeat protein [Deltaproteobacteria bacterium]